MSDAFDAAVEIRESIWELRQAQADAKERRRYALLQTAAMIYAATYRPFESEGEPGGFDAEIESSVVTAEMLLAIIEKREAQS